jgi:copper transport protein
LISRAIAAGRPWSLAIVLALAVVPFGEAQAHASLLSSTPANGGHLAASPERIRLVFNEPIVASLSHLMLAGVNGRESQLDVTADPHEVHAIESIVPMLRDGAYRVTWHIISADGHPVSGSIAFSVGSVTDVGALGVVAHNDGQMEMSDDEPMFAGAALTPALLRGLALSALLSLCGLLGFISYGKGGSTAQIRLCTWLSVLAAALLTIHLIVWLIHVSPENQLDETIVQAALSREVGLNELLRLLFTALAAWAILLARRLKLAFALALAAVIAGGAIGHAAAIQPLIAIPMKSLHLVGVAFWLGGLLWLASSDASRDITASANTVSSIATISIVIVGITGVVQSFLFLPNFSDLFASAYGLTLLGKVTGLAALGAFGAYHRYKLLPRLTAVSGGVLQKSVKREIAVMILVVMLGGFLAYVPTPHIP